MRVCREALSGAFFTAGPARQSLDIELEQKDWPGGRGCALINCARRVCPDAGKAGGIGHVPAPACR